MAVTAGYYDYMRIAAAGNGIIAAQNPADDFGSSVLGGTFLFGGGIGAFQGGAWVWKNRGNYASAWQAAKQNAISAKAPKALVNGQNWFKNIQNRNYWQNIRLSESKIPNTPKFDTRAYNALKIGEEREKFIQNFRNSIKEPAIFSNARTELAKIKAEVKAGTLKGSELKARLNKFNNMIYKAELRALESPGQKGFMWKFNKYTGMNWAKRKSLQAAIKEGTTTADKATRFAGKASRTFIKNGGPITFAIELGCEFPDIIETYSKLGAAKGTKQLGKSAAVAGASAVGFAVGAKAGGILGAKIGTAVGACFGGIGAPVGTFVGTIVGIGCGLFGGWLLRKGAKSAVGPSELEKEQKAQNYKNTIAMVMNKNKQLKTCSELYVKAKLGQIQLDNATIESMGRIIKGREAEFEKLVNQNMQKIKKGNLNLSV